MATSTNHRKTVSAPSTEDGLPQISRTRSKCEQYRMDKKKYNHCDIRMKSTNWYNNNHGSFTQKYKVASPDSGYSDDSGQHNTNNYVCKHSGRNAKFPSIQRRGEQHINTRTKLATCEAVEICDSTIKTMTELNNNNNNEANTRVGRENNDFVTVHIPKLRRTVTYSGPVSLTAVKTLMSKSSKGHRSFEDIFIPNSCHSTGHKSFHNSGHRIYGCSQTPKINNVETKKDFNDIKISSTIQKNVEFSNDKKESLFSMKHEIKRMKCYPRASRAQYKPSPLLVQAPSRSTTGTPHSSSERSDESASDGRFSSLRVGVFSRTARRGSAISLYPISTPVVLVTSSENETTQLLDERDVKNSDYPQQTWPTAIETKIRYRNIKKTQDDEYSFYRNYYGQQESRDRRPDNTRPYSSNQDRSRKLEIALLQNRQQTKCGQESIGRQTDMNSEDKGKDLSNNKDSHCKDTRPEDGSLRKNDTQSQKCNPSPKELIENTAIDVINTGKKLGCVKSSADYKHVPPRLVFDNEDPYSKFARRKTTLRNSHVVNMYNDKTRMEFLKSKLSKPDFYSLTNIELSHQVNSDGEEEDLD